MTGEVRGEAATNEKKSDQPDSTDGKHWSARVAQLSTAAHTSTDGKLAGAPRQAERHSADVQHLAFADAPTAPQDYKTAHALHLKRLDRYWESADQSQKQHKLITEFPPSYDGPPRPKDSPGQKSDKTPSTLPSIKNMLDQSTELNRLAYGDKSRPDFKVHQIDEDAFKHRYAEEAVRVGKQNGLSKGEVKQIVQRLYGFEDGGWGTAETLSGMTPSMVRSDSPSSTTISDARHDFHPGSTAIGYTQVLLMSTVRHIEEHSQNISGRLDEMAKQDPARSADLKEKSQLIGALHKVVHKELDAFSKCNLGQAPYVNDKGNFTEDLYSDFAKSKVPTSLGLTGRQLSTGLHALHLDGDVGPIIQVQELGDSIEFARNNGFKQLLQEKIKAMNSSASQYDGLPAQNKSKAIDEVFAQFKTPDSLRGSAAHDFETARDSLQTKINDLPQGPNNRLAKETLNKDELRVLSNVLTERKFGQQSGPLSPEASSLLDKVWISHLPALTPGELMPAAIELSNLAGPNQALAMLQPDKKDALTPNFFTRQGYEGNPVTNGRTAGELFLQTQRVMLGDNADRNRPGVAAFLRAFDDIH